LNRKIRKRRRRRRRKWNFNMASKSDPSWSTA